MRRFLRDNVIVLLLLNLANLFSYLFQVMLGRSLDPEMFGVFNAINSMAVLLSAPLTILPVIFSRFTVELSQENMSAMGSLLRQGLKWVFLAAMGGLLVLVLALPILKSLLHVDETLPMLLMFVFIMGSMLFPVLLGILQGLHRYLRMGVMASSLMFFRFLFGVLLVYVLGYGVNGALFSSIAGVAVAILLGIWGLRDLVTMPAHPLPAGIFRRMFLYGVPVFASSISFLMLSTLDIILVRHYCSPEEAGHYAAAAVLGRITIFLPDALVYVLFPEIARARERGVDDLSLIRTSLLVSAGLGMVVVGVCWLGSEWIMRILFGESYLPAAPMLGTISLAMAMLALVNILFSYHLARLEYHYLWIAAGGVALLPLLVHFNHGSAYLVSQVLILVIGLVLALLLAQMAWRNRRNRPIPQTP